jgi:TolA-binding protein
MPSTPVSGWWVWVATLMVLALCPRPVWANGAARAGRAYADGDYQKALDLLPGDLSQDPEARLLRARVLVELGRYAEAHQALRGLLLKLPQMRDLIRLLQGEALLGQGKALEAAQRFRQAMRAKDSRWVDHARHRRADALRAARRFALAAKEYRKLARIYPDHPERAELELAVAECLERSRQPRKAAAVLQELRYRWPTSAAADKAQERLEQLARRRIRPQPQPLTLRLQRVRALRRGKRYAQALAELDLLDQAAHTEEEQVSLHLERVRILLKHGDAKEALAVLQGKLKATRTKTVRRLTADALSRLGRVDEAVAVLPAKRGRPHPAELPYIARFLAEHARYTEAMKLVDTVAARLPEKLRKRYLLNRAYWAYRAGRYDLAVEGFRHLAKHAPRERDYALYWEARAHARAGRTKEAEDLYRQLVEKYLWSYYGIQARSRLVEAGKLSVTGGSKCRFPEPKRSPPDPQLPALLDQLITRHQDLYPSLDRVKTFWRLGMLKDARRELRLIAIDFAWIKARGRPRRYVHRPAVERIWRGGQPKRRRWNKRAKEIYKVRASLGPLLGELMERAGIFFYGWRLKPRDDSLMRHYHPRGYASLVSHLARQYGLDPNMVWAIMKTESTFRTDVLSRAGAIGLMQIMPVTAARIAAEMKLDTFHLDRLFEPEVNLTMACWYLRAVSTKFKGQLMLVAAAYNGGPHNVAKWLDRRGQKTDLDEFIEEIPFSESRRYAKKILRLVAAYERTWCQKDNRLTSNNLDPRYGDHPNY